MKLLVDLGNTRIKWALLIDGTIKFGGAHAYKDSSLIVALNSDWKKLNKPEQVWIANVAGEELEELLRTWIQQTWNVPTEFIHSTSQYKNIVNAYAEPHRLGVDRWLNIIAARQLSTNPVCIVDCGSFLTVDVINANGLHLGGYITPGLEMMYAALSDYSQGRLAVDRRLRVNSLSLGKNTKDCTMNGCMQMLVAFINQITVDIEHSVGSDVSYVITGGDAEALLPWLRKDYIHHPALVFEGLALIVYSNIQVSFDQKVAYEQIELNSLL